jgi:hypothetical protein
MLFLNFIAVVFSILIVPPNLPQGLQNKLEGGLSSDGLAVSSYSLIAKSSNR